MYNMKDNRAPGIDGIPVEFYKCFWDSLRVPYINMVNECWELEEMPISMRTAILSLIHKAGRYDKLKNYRPISLLNADYKILAFVFAERLQTVIGCIVKSDQSAYIRGRYIGCSIRNLIDLYDYVENNDMPGALLSIDYEKAFDSVEHVFMIEVLKRFNFGEQFIRWMKIFYRNPLFRVKNNGWISQPYTMYRGLRQGCPISALKFILVVEVLANVIRKCKWY